MSLCVRHVRLLAILAIVGVLVPLDRATPAPSPAPDRDREGAALTRTPAAEMAWGAGTVGASAVVHEVVRTQVEGETAVLYTVRVSGFGTGQRVHVWMRRQSGVVQFLADDVVANQKGVLMSGGVSPEAFLVLAVGYAVDEPFVLAVVNAERTVRAFAHAVPLAAGRGLGRSLTAPRGPAGS